jgi:hypothetical protein
MSALALLLALLCAGSDGVWACCTTDADCGARMAVLAWDLDEPVTSPVLRVEARP